MAEEENNNKNIGCAVLGLIGLILATIGYFGDSDTNDNKAKDEKEAQNKEQPANPDIKTDHGQLPNGYRTMDEYYINENGEKVYHGYRKNLYPSGQPKMVSKYEHGKLQWTKEYDKAGNLVKSY